MSILTGKSPRLIKTLRPTVDETEQYAHLILEHEGRPPSSLPDCRREAELQLWVERSLSLRAGRKAGRHPTVAG